MDEDLEQLERAGWRALSGPDGAAFYADLMADDGLMVFPGMIMTKADALAAIAAAEPWSSFELSDLRSMRDSDVAVVAYTATARRGDATYTATMTSTYVQRDGRWRLLLHQQSPDPS
jgi:uncharacterized protein (TIGR02246 family)